jgi:hypothetical protein
VAFIGPEQHKDAEVVQRPTAVVVSMYRLREWRRDERRGRGGGELVSTVTLHGAVARVWPTGAVAGLDAGEGRSWAGLTYWASTVLIGYLCDMR